MVKTLFVAALGNLLVLTAPSPARANVIYTFSPATVMPSDPTDSRPVIGGGFKLEVRDAAIQARSFNLDGSGAGQTVSYVGDIGNFVSFTGEKGGPSSEEFVTPVSLRGTISITLNFSTQGNVETGSVDFFGTGSDFTFSISNNSVSGQFLTENGGDACSAFLGCAETGTLVITRTPSSVPEPGSLVLLGIGVAGLGVAARQRRRVTAAA